MRRRAGRKRLADWIGAHVNAFSVIGGCQRRWSATTSRPASPAACRYEPGINLTYQELAEHYDTVILPTRPRRPRDKAKVEVAVQIVQRFVLARLRNRRFFSLHELNAAIRAAVADLNAKIMRKLGVGRESYSQKSIGRRSKPFRRRPTSMPSGRSAGWRPATTSRSPITITPAVHDSIAHSSRRASPLALARGDGHHARLLKSLACIELLILDDWGLAPMTAEQRRDLLEIMEDRHGRRSTMVTSQLPFEHWHEIIGDPTLADAILDRLVRNAHRLALEGESLRKAAAKRQTLDDKPAN